MSITFYCPFGHVLIAEDHQAGEEIVCKLCNQRAIVPELLIETFEDRPADSAPEDSLDVTEDPPAPVPPPASEPLAPQSEEPESEPEKTVATAPVAPAAIPDDAYRAGAAHVQSVRWLAAGLGLLTAFGAAPAVLHFGDQPASTWVWLTLFVTMLQSFFLVWMVATPDWAAVRVVMAFFVLVAVCYGLVAIWLALIATAQSMPWGLAPVYLWAPRWCLVALLASALGAYLCTHVSRKWRRSFALEMMLAASRRKAAKQNGSSKAPVSLFTD